MIARSFFAHASLLLLSTAAFLHPTWAEAGICEDLAAARAAAASGDPVQDLDDEIERAKERVTVAMRALDAANSGVTLAGSEQAVAASRYAEVAPYFRRELERQKRYSPAFSI